MKNILIIIAFLFLWCLHTIKTIIGVIFGFPITIIYFFVSYVLDKNCYRRFLRKLTPKIRFLPINNDEYKLEIESDGISFYRGKYKLEVLIRGLYSHYDRLVYYTFVGQLKDDLINYYLRKVYKSNRKVK